eukprot:6349095-Heterocapsa_arctica.AAC.1
MPSPVPALAPRQRYGRRRATILRPSSGRSAHADRRPRSGELCLEEARPFGRGPPARPGGTR